MKDFKPLSWNVKKFDFNKQTIEDYDVLKYREDFIKKLKKKCETKEEFVENLRREFQWQYWSRCEYELIVKITEEERILLIPWCGCRNEEQSTIDVTDDLSFDWAGFANHHVDRQHRNYQKIDIYDQLTYGEQFEKLVTYLWNTRLKYERRRQ